MEISLQICLWQGDICAAAPSRFLPPKVTVIGGKDGANTEFHGDDVVQLQHG